MSSENEFAVIAETVSSLPREFAPLRTALAASGTFFRHLDFHQDNVIAARCRQNLWYECWWAASSAFTSAVRINVWSSLNSCQSMYYLVKTFLLRTRKHSTLNLMYLYQYYKVNSWRFHEKHCISIVDFAHFRQLVCRIIELMLQIFKLRSWNILTWMNFYSKIYVSLSA